MLHPEDQHSVESYKRLDRGTFKIPEAPHAGAPYVEVDDATLEALLDGIEVDVASKPPPPRTH